MPDRSDRSFRLIEHVHVAAADTARVIITAEERLRQRVRSVLRVAVATIFLAISGLISLGANVTTAFAKKVSSDRGKGTPAELSKRTIHLKVTHYRHSGRRHHTKAWAKDHAAHLRPSHAMRGVASWYGKQFHNRKTASGVRFNTHAMMAAHRTLPFGTKVRVTNLANQKSVVVKIMDRGPYAKGRIIDLSLAAAEQLGMTQAGTAQVQLEILGSAAPSMFEDIAADKNASSTIRPVLDQIPHDGPALPALADEETDH